MKRLDILHDYIETTPQFQVYASVNHSSQVVSTKNRAPSEMALSE